MDFESILLQDELAVEFMLKNPELIKFAFSVEDGCPEKFLLRKVNSFTVDRASKIKKIYSLFPIALSRQTNCSTCNGMLKIKKCIDSTLYDDVFGSVEIKIITKFCGNCKATVYPGFLENSTSKTRLYDDDWSKYKIFVSTHCSSFSTDFLRRLVALKQKCHVTFFGRTAAYNYQHGYTSKSNKESMDHRRLIEGYFKYIYLEFKERHQKELVVRGQIYDDLDNGYEDAYESFKRKHSSHTCEVAGCESCVIIDGHMKAHRKVCADKTCKNDPKSKSVYCSFHAEKPMREVIHGEQQLQDGDEYHVEKILCKKIVKKEWLYEVKWKGFDETTWEPKANIPRILVEFFEIYGNSAISSEINGYFEKGGTKYVSISVEGEILQLPAISLEVNERAYYTPSPDHVSCNTNKSKNRFHHRTGGILVMGKPCGILTHVEEIFGAESISNVAEMVEKALVELPTTQVVVYDDACHLNRHVRNRGKVYAELSKREMRVDRFHFPNHVDPWCKKNMDPNKSSLLRDVNTEKMEQVFAWVKGYAGSLKYMKRSTFNFMILDLIDRHNDELMKKV